MVTDVPPTPERLLIFGGTFDPPHRGHVELPQHAARELRCQRIIYIPAALNPLKTAPETPMPTPAIHRLAMLRLALADAPTAEISTIELDRSNGRPSYTIDTLRALSGARAPHHTSPQQEWFLLIGSDQALDFHRWKDWQEIVRLATPAVMLREPWNATTFAVALRERYDAAEARQWMEWTLRTLPTIDISATEIRRLPRQGKSLAGLVSPRVEAYIREHRLYLDDTA
jgi:nicotinate-nucleotide adenylyltransferase